MFALAPLVVREWDMLCRCLLLWILSGLALTKGFADISQIANKALRVAGIGREGAALGGWVSEVRARGRVDATLEKLKPADDQNSQSWAVYGFACEVLDKRADAIAAYRKVISLRRRR